MIIDVAYQIGLRETVKWLTQFLKLIPQLFVLLYVKKQSPAGLRPCNFIKKKTPTQVFSYEFCRIFQNIFFTEHLRWLPLYIQKLKILTYLKIS